MPPAGVRRTGTVGGPRQPRTRAVPRSAFGELIAAADSSATPEVETEGNGSGFLLPPPGWRPLETHEGAAEAYFVRVQNVVCTCSTNIDFNTSLAAALCHGRYDARVFPAATIPMAWPFSTVCTFATGNLVITGVRDAMQGLAAGLVFLRKMSQHTQKEYRLFNFRVENVVGSAAVGHCIDLERLCAENDPDTLFYPEVFAGLSYRPKERPDLPLFRNGRTVVGVFRKGRLVICGASSPEHLVQVFLYMFDFLRPYML